MTVKNILAKYENFYKGGSGYTFQISVDDFNAIVKYMSEQQKDIDLLVNKVDEHLDEKEEIREERKGFKTFLQQTSDIDKRVDALIKEQALKIRELEVNVSDFERVVEEQTKEIEGLRIVLEAERGFIQNREDSCEDYGYEVYIVGEKRYFKEIDDVIDHIKSSVYFEVDGQDLKVNLKHLSKKEAWIMKENVWVKRL